MTRYEYEPCLPGPNIQGAYVYSMVAVRARPLLVKMHMHVDHLFILVRIIRMNTH